MRRDALRPDVSWRSRRAAEGKGGAAWRRDRTRAQPRAAAVWRRAWRARGGPAPCPQRAPWHLALTRSLAHSLTRSLAHSLTRSLAHSLTRACVCVCVCVCVTRACVRETRACVRERILFRFQVFRAFFPNDYN